MLSMLSASLNSTPWVAARPVATIIDIGVARPSAQGQAIISTATALTRPCAQLGDGPQNPHTNNEIMAMTTTATKKEPDTTAANRCLAARERYACETVCIICDSTVAPPPFSPRFASATPVSHVTP